MAGLMGKGIVKYQESYGNVRYTNSKANNRGENFRQIKKVLEGKRFVAIGGKGINTILYDRKNVETDKAVLAIIDELDKIGKYTITNKAKYGCDITFRNGTTAILGCHNSKLFAWAYKKFYSYSKRSGLNSIDMID